MVFIEAIGLDSKPIFKLLSRFFVHDLEKMVEKKSDPCKLKLFFKMQTFDEYTLNQRDHAGQPLINYEDTLKQVVGVKRIEYELS